MVAPELGGRPKWGGLTASALNAKHFEPVQYVVPGILPEGLAILAGRPKFGKSFLAMDLSLAVASGGYAMGSVMCEPRRVLYAALEDGERRLQDRLRKMRPGGNVPDTLHFETKARRLGDGLEDDLADFLAHYPDTGLVWLDTWRCIKPSNIGKSASAYDEDAQGLAPLHELTKDHPGVAFGLIHHVRKAESDDVFDTISGTHGLTGVADTLMVLGAFGEGAKLSGQGRDIGGYEKALNRDVQSGAWIISGEARELAKTAERQAIVEALSEAEGESMTTAAIASLVGKSKSNVSHLLKRLQKEQMVVGAGFGKWRLSPHSTSSNRSTYGGDND